MLPTTKKRRGPSPKRTTSMARPCTERPITRRELQGTGARDGDGVCDGDGVRDGAIRVAVTVGAGVRVIVSVIVGEDKGVAGERVEDGDGLGGRGEGTIVLVAGSMSLVGVEWLATHPVNVKISASRKQRVFTIKTLRRLFFV